MRCGTCGCTIAHDYDAFGDVMPDPHAAELARLRGERDRLQRAYVETGEQLDNTIAAEARLSARLDAVTLERDAHKRRAERLEAALRLVARWLGSGDVNATFDDIADWFYAETGMLRPGKSQPPEMCNAHSDDEREARFRTWAREKGAAVRAAIRAALDDAARGKDGG